jgi:hypothetical protein
MLALSLLYARQGTLKRAGILQLARLCSKMSDGNGVADKRAFLLKLGVHDTAYASVGPAEAASAFLKASR